MNNKWGFINKKGEEIIAFNYENATFFSEQLCAVKLNNKWGFVDKTGEKIIDFKYEEVSNFTEGLAPVKMNEKWGYIDKSGEWVIEPILDYAYSFSEELGCIGIADKDNNILYGYIHNPLTFNEKDIENIEDENESGSYKSCNETVNGWEGNISNIHKIETTGNQLIIKWEYLNNEYGIVIYEGKGTKGKKIFKENKIKYTGEKTIKIKPNTKFITVQIIAKKQKTEWKYTVECL